MTTAQFFLDVLLDALAVALAVRLCGGRIRPLGVGAAAIAGALVAQMAAVRTLPRGQAACLWLPTAMGMMLLAGGRRALRRPVRCGLLLLCAEGLLGGTVLSLYGATGSLPLAYALGGACTLAVAANAVRARRTARDVRGARVVCRYRGQTAAFDAMIDSGNTLRDYLTHLPVIVVPETAGRRRLRLGESVLRPIFADTAGGRQMMGVLAPQEIRIKTEESQRVVRALVALSPGMAEETPALVPAALMEDA